MHVMEIFFLLFKEQILISHPLPNPYPPSLPPLILHPWSCVYSVHQLWPILVGDAQNKKGRETKSKLVHVGCHRRLHGIQTDGRGRGPARNTHAQKVRGARHSSFGGTYVIKNQKSISGAERVYHRSIAGESMPRHSLESSR